MSGNQSCLRCGARRAYLERKHQTTRPGGECLAMSISAKPSTKKQTDQDTPPRCERFNAAKLRNDEFSKLSSVAKSGPVSKRCYEPRCPSQSQQTSSYPYDPARYGSPATPPAYPTPSPFAQFVMLPEAATTNLVWLQLAAFSILAATKAPQITTPQTPHLPNFVVQR